MANPEAQVNSAYHKSAKASWQMPLLLFVLLIVAGKTGARVIVELTGLLLMVVGFCCALFALAGIKRHGARGILAPAICGLVINGLMLLIFFTNYTAARARTLERQRATPESQNSHIQ